MDIRLKLFRMLRQLDADMPCMLMSVISRSIACDSKTFRAASPLMTASTT